MVKKKFFSFVSLFLFFNCFINFLCILTKIYQWKWCKNIFKKPLILSQFIFTKLALWKLRVFIAWSFAFLALQFVPKATSNSWLSNYPLQNNPKEGEKKASRTCSGAARRKKSSIFRAWRGVCLNQRLLSFFFCARGSDDIITRGHDVAQRIWVKAFF